MITCLNPLSPNPTKWANTLKQFVDNLCLNLNDSLALLINTARQSYYSKIVKKL